MLDQTPPRWLADSLTYAVAVALDANRLLSINRASFVQTLGRAMDEDLDQVARFFQLPGKGPDPIAPSERAVLDLWLAGIVEEAKPLQVRYREQRAADAEAERLEAARKVEAARVRREAEEAEKWAAREREEAQYRDWKSRQAQPA